ncbi:MAG: aminoacyl-tRNA hydrolase [Bacteroidota bacterium]
MDKFLIVGLGNIGEEYANTRHNIGFDVVNAFVKKYNGSWQIGRLAEQSVIKLKGRQVVLVKPTTYMNLSGRAFKYWMDHEKVPLANTLTIVDEIALPLERIRIRPAGSDAGHNGLKDIQKTLGTDAYPKLRFGIGNQYPKGGQVNYVLGKWQASEMPVVLEKIDTCVMVIEQFVLLGIDAAMNQYNKLIFKV